jgi:hypothetical protein
MAIIHLVSSLLFQGCPGSMNHYKFRSRSYSCFRTLSYALVKSISVGNWLKLWDSVQQKINLDLKRKACKMHTAEGIMGTRCAQMAYGIALWYAPVGDGAKKCLTRMERVQSDGSLAPSAPLHAEPKFITIQGRILHTTTPIQV